MRTPPLISSVKIFVACEAKRGDLTPVVLRIDSGDASDTANTAETDRHRGALTRHDFWHRFCRYRPGFRAVFLRAVLLRLLTGSTDRLCHASYARHPAVDDRRYDFAEMPANSIASAFGRSRQRAPGGAASFASR